MLRGGGFFHFAQDLWEVEGLAAIAAVVFTQAFHCY
jgi:hypothetical protein